MSVFEIPLNDFAEIFQIEIAGQNFTFKTRWNESLNRWILDIGRDEQTWIINNLAMVSGIDLLSQFDHLQLGFQLYVQVDGDSEAEMGESNIGKEARLLVKIDD